jgi:hypothetical protein
MDEVLGWFRDNDVEFVSSIPSIGDTEFQDDEPLFAPHPVGSRLERVSSEIEMLISGGRDGGLFIMIGRKRGGATSSRRSLQPSGPAPEATAG